MKLSVEASHEVHRDHEAIAAYQIYLAHLSEVDISPTQLTDVQGVWAMRRLLDDIRAGKLATITANVIADGCGPHCRHGLPDGKGITR